MTQYDTLFEFGSGYFYQITLIDQFYLFGFLDALKSLVILVLFLKKIGFCVKRKRFNYILLSIEFNFCLIQFNLSNELCCFFEMVSIIFVSTFVNLLNAFLVVIEQIQYQVIVGKLLQVFLCLISYFLVAIAIHYMQYIQNQQ